MHKTKNKRNKLFKKTRKYRKYYGGSEDVHPLKENELIGNVIGDKISRASSAMLDYVKEKGLRLLGLQEINPEKTTTIEETNQINETVNKAAEEVSNFGNNLKEQTSNTINTLTNGLESGAVKDSVTEAAKNLSESGTELMHEFNKAVSTPEFKEETKSAFDNAAIIADIAVKAADKPVNDAIDVINEAGQKTLSAVASGSIKVATDAMAAIPGYGALIEVGKIANDVSTAAGDVVEATTSATGAISNAVTETSNNINESIQKLEEAKKHAVMPTNAVTETENNLVQQGGFKELVIETNQVAGRISDSIDKFNNPIHYSIMKNHYNKTKKYSVMNKGKTKRVRFSL